MEQNGHLFTIGCSTRSLSDFILMLKKYKIQVVADVRSTPYSHFTPQFNADCLKNELHKNRIMYGSFAEEFGARRVEDSVYIGNTVDFTKVMELDIFHKGVERIKNGLNAGYSIALTCTEYNPLDCHRFSLVSRGIRKTLNIPIDHIFSQNLCKPTEDLENELLLALNLQPELFENKNMLIERAYNILGKKVAYSRVEKPEPVIYA
ncbi:DUF488 family protein [Treponema sp. UBA6852]|uniref:DUF488 domain-containing protein n=1 Tax=Treponema sp. UBA6852 TaxID=1947744 RepID=UPI000E81DF37|nr:DUF488 domain-containing protein [Treponema sp. UBA6852]HBP09874.1 hypothetical protein [Treponema sp.]